jgi:hypothetical protein
VGRIRGRMDQRKKSEESIGGFPEWRGWDEREVLRRSWRLPKLRGVVILRIWTMET